jgi:acetyl-CoA acetyltransferase
MREAVVLGVGMTRFGRFARRSLRALGREAIDAALKDAGVSPRELQVAFGASAVGAFGGPPVFNVHSSASSAATAFHLAWLAVASGEYDCVLAFGVEKLAQSDRRDDDDDTDHHARTARAYMARHGVTPRHLASIASKNHAHASLNPLAQCRTQMSVDEVLGDRMVAAPLTRAMCSAAVEGAAAAVIVSPDLGRRRGTAPVRVAASVLRSGSPERSDVTARAANAAYERAGIGPADVDLYEVHDATASAELIAYEELGLCAAGRAALLVDEGVTALGGRQPVNPSGGLVCRGRSAGASSLAQIAELTWQLRGDAGPRQIPRAKVAVAQSVGGRVDADDAACCVTVLLR